MALPRKWNRPISRRELFTKVFGHRGNPDGALPLMVGGAGLALGLMGTVMPTSADLPGDSARYVELADYSVGPHPFGGQVSRQNIGFTSTFSFTAGDILFCFSSVEFQTDLNNLMDVNLFCEIEGVDIQTFSIYTPATGAGDYFIPSASVFGFRTLATGGTKQFRVGIAHAQGPSVYLNGVVWDLLMYRVRRA